MRKIIIMFIIMVASFGVLSAQDKAPQISIGLSGLAEYYSITGTYSGNSATASTALIGVSAYLDLIYADISVGFKTQVADSSAKSTMGFSTTTPNEHMGYLSMRLLGKIPLRLSDGFQLFPFVGFQYDVLVADDYYASFTQAQKDAANDLYLIAGLGSDINFGDTVYLRIMLDADFNLTPAPASPGLLTYTGFNFGGSVGIGFHL